MRTITECRSCASDRLTDVLDLGEQYVSDFREDDSKPNKYPINAVICEECMLVQLRHTTPSGDMYHDNYGFKSGVSDSIKADLKEIVEEGLTYKPMPQSWLDIASNDGTLLSYIPAPVFKVGVDPIGFLCKEAEQHGDVIINDFFSADQFRAGDVFDVVTSISCFYDMDDPNQFVSDVKEVLAPEGVWIIQQNYLLPTMQLHAVDNFCHEHLEYYTLLSLENLLYRHDLKIIDVSTSMVNGGSIRTVVAHAGSSYVERSAVKKQRDIERHAGLYDIKPYLTFGEGVKAQLANLERTVKGLVAEGELVYILAASTRGSTIWQGANLDETVIPYAVERNPAKVGKYFSAIGIPIISEEEARAKKPNYMLVGPWFFAFPEIVERERQYIEEGGSLIIPLPELRVVNKDNIDAPAS